MWRATALPLRLNDEMHRPRSCGSVPHPVSVNRFEDAIVLLGPLARQRARTAAEALAPRPLRRDYLHLDLDLLAVRESQVFVELDRPASDFSTCQLHHAVPDS